MRRYVPKAQRPLKPGPLARHGGYSVARKDALIKRCPEIGRYLKAIQRDLIRDIEPRGEEHLTAARRIILDRLMSKLATARLIETYIAEHGMLRRDGLAKKVLEAEPIMSLWLALNAQIRADVQLLGLERRALELEELDPLDVAASIDAAKRGAGGPTLAQDGRTRGAEAKDTGASP